MAIAGFVLCVFSFILFVMAIALGNATPPTGTDGTVYENTAALTSSDAMGLSVFVKGTMGGVGFFAGIIGCCNTFVFYKADCIKIPLCFCGFVCWPVTVALGSLGYSVAAFVGMGTVADLDAIDCY